MRELTDKQKKAIARNNAIRRLRYCILNLRGIKDNLFHSYMLKGMINSAILSLEKLLEHLQRSKLSSYNTYLDDFNKIRE